jgi:hypothetical protein
VLESIVGRGYDRHSQARKAVRIVSRVLFGSVFALTAFVSSGHAQVDDRIWGFVASRNDVRLFYGLEDSDQVTLNLICDPKRKRMQIVSTVLPPKPVAGRSVTTELRGDAGSFEFTGKIVANRDSGSYISAPMAIDSRPFNLLKAGLSLTVEVQGARQVVPLKDVKEPLTKMERACLGKR